MRSTRVRRHTSIMTSRLDLISNSRERRRNHLQGLADWRRRDKDRDMMPSGARALRPAAKWLLADLDVVAGRRHVAPAVTINKCAQMMTLMTTPTVASPKSSIE